MVPDPNIVVLIGPTGCGKTSILAAVANLAERTHIETICEPSIWSIAAPQGVGLTAGTADVELNNALQNIRKGKSAPRTGGGPFMYKVGLNCMEHRDYQIDCVVVDAPGGDILYYYYPASSSAAASATPTSAAPASATPAAADPRKPGIRPLRDNLSDAGISCESGISLIVFVNEPRRETKKLRPFLPKSFEQYLYGLRIERVVFYVACADAILPLHGNLEATLRDFNVSETLAALEYYAGIFRGTAQRAFARHFLHWLALRDGHSEVKILWGSSLGCRSDKSTNTEILSGPTEYSVLIDPEDWNPLFVPEALLWACGVEIRRNASG